MTTAQSTPAEVINFAAVGTSRPARRNVKKRPVHMDADLIEHCIEYGMQINAAQAAYKVDPTDSEFASFFDDLCRSRANRAMRAVLELPPKTLDGLRAKAELIQIVCKDWESLHGSVELDELRTEFVHSLASDIVRLQRAAYKTSHLPFMSQQAAE